MNNETENLDCNRFFSTFGFQTSKARRPSYRIWIGISTFWMTSNEVAPRARTIKDRKSSRSSKFLKKTTLNLHWRSAICVRLLTSKKSLLLIDSMTDSQLSEQRTNLRPHYFELWRSSLSSRSGQLFRKELTFLHFARSKKFIEFNFLIQLVALI